MQFRANVLLLLSLASIALVANSSSEAPLEQYDTSPVLAGASLPKMADVFKPATEEFKFGVAMGAKKTSICRNRGPLSVKNEKATTTEQSAPEVPAVLPPKTSSVQSTSASNDDVALQDIVDDIVDPTFVDLCAFTSDGYEINVDKKRWPDAVVYYKTNLEGQHRERLAAAMENIARKTCFTFKDTEPEDPRQGHLFFRAPPASCSAFIYGAPNSAEAVDRHNCRHQLYGTPASVDDITKELAQAIGLTAEQSTYMLDPYGY